MEKKRFFDDYHNEEKESKLAKEKEEKRREQAEFEEYIDKLTKEIEVEGSNRSYNSDEFTIAVNHPEVYLRTRSAITTGFLDENMRFIKVDPNDIDASVIIGCKRIQVIFNSDELFLANPLDYKWLKDYFKDNKDFVKHLLEAHKIIEANIKFRATKRGYNCAYIVNFVYRINEELKLFNILATWTYAKRVIELHENPRINNTNEDTNKFITNIDYNNQNVNIHIIDGNGISHRLIKKDLEQFRVKPYYEKDAKSKLYYFEIIAKKLNTDYDVKKNQTINNFIQKMDVEINDNICTFCYDVQTFKNELIVKEAKEKIIDDYSEISLFNDFEQTQTNTQSRNKNDRYEIKVVLSLQAAKGEEV